jgi:hypothetical protein
VTGSIQQFGAGLMAVAVFFAAGLVFTFYPRAFLRVVDRLSERLPIVFLGYRSKLLWAYTHSTFNIAMMRVTGILCFGASAVSIWATLRYLGMSR